MLFLLLFACESDYKIVEPRNDVAGGDALDLDPPPPYSEPPCEHPTFPAEQVDIDASCLLEPELGQFYPEVQWHMDTFEQKPESRDVMSMPAVAHLTDDDGDGVFGSEGDIPDIAVLTFDDNDDFVLRVISGDGSAVHWSKWREKPQGQGQPAIGDIDNDGKPEIVVATTTGQIAAYEDDGRLAWLSEVFLIDDEWSGNPADFDEFCTSPAISDMDGDGRPEVIAGRVILDGPTGATQGVGQYGIGRAERSSGIGTTSFAVDIDLDGEQEVITGNAFYRKDGTPWSRIDDEDGFVAVGNLDGDDEGELVVVRSGTVTAYNHDFSTLWGPVTLDTVFGGPPTIADFDGDGEAEIGVASISLYTVLETDGSTLWTRPTQDETSGVTGSSVFDFENDGVYEVVYADETRLWVFNGPDGEVKLESGSHTSNTWLEYPTIADVDADGHAEIVLGHNPYWGGTKERHGLSVIADQGETWAGTRQIWNQHAYHLTNVLDDAGIPHVAAVNWLEENTFRAAKPFPLEPVPAPDLSVEVVEVCVECGSEKVFIWVRVVNEGMGAASEVVLGVWAGETRIDELLIGELEAGKTTEGMRFVVTPEQAEDVFFSVVGETEECDFKDNELSWGEMVCEDTD